MKKGFPKLLLDVGLLCALAVFSAVTTLMLRPNCDAPLSSNETEAESLQNDGDKYPHPVLSLNQLQAYMETSNPILIDARRARSYQRGHIPGAISMPSTDFSNVYDEMRDQLEPHRNQLVVVYCDSIWCGAASVVQEHLIHRDFSSVGIFVDGIRKWRGEGLPEEES